MKFDKIYSFTNLLSLTNKKRHFWWQNPLEAIYCNKHSILDSKKMAKFGTCGKRFDKACMF